MGSRARLGALFAILFSSPAPLVGLASALGVAGAVVLTSGEAAARTSVESRYGFDRTWNAAIRLVRVDLGLKVVEKDDGAGYLLFEYKSPESGNKITSGSVELVRPREGDGAVHVVVQLPQMPRYHEMALADSLTKKMRTEYGEPPPRTPSRPRDAGADSGEKSSE